MTALVCRFNCYFGYQIKSGTDDSDIRFQFSKHLTIIIKELDILGTCRMVWPAGKVFFGVGRRNGAQLNIVCHGDFAHYVVKMAKSTNAGNR